MPNARLLAVVTVVLLAAGCSSGSSAPAPSAGSTTPAPPSAAAPASSPAATAAPCPDGAYLVTAFEGRGEASGAGKGTGGNITADFSSGTFTLGSDGTKPMRLDLGAAEAELRFDGEITGTYAGDPSVLRLSTTGARGDAVVKGFGVSRRYPVRDLAEQLFGAGVTAQVSCDDEAGTAVVVLPNATLALTRQG